MNKKYLKTGILSILIIGCIVQTVMLWLGGMLSHNFLEKNTRSQSAIEPVNVWLLTASGTGQGSTSALAYPMSKSRRETETEYEQRLIMELQEVLKTIPEDVKVEKVEGINWEKLFSVSGIVYEYAIPVGMQEITGVRVEGEAINQITNIDKIFLQSNTKFTKELTLHMMDTQHNQLFTLQVPGEFSEFSKIYDYMLKNEKSIDATKYQPSAVSNMQRYIAGNTFMPIASSNMPINYLVLSITNPISTDREQVVKDLERYVEGFFLNPLLKDIEYKENGNIAFMEYKGGYVVYNPIGTLEYTNMKPKNQGYSTVLGSYNTALEFIQNSTAIHESMRDDLYLSDIIKGSDSSYTCYFDMNFKGFDVTLSSQIQEKIGQKSLVQVTVKNNQVIRAKISLLEITPKIANGILQPAQLISEYVDPINQGLEKINKAGYESIIFQDSKAMYVVENLSGSIYLTRGILFDNRWYYLE